MALVESNPFQTGKIAPDFQLMDTVSNRLLTLNDLKGLRGTIIFFICNHCPYVKHVNAELVRLANDYGKKGVGFVAISSNDVNVYQEDRPEKMKVLALELGYPFPYLYDPTQEVAKSYDAACTPDFYLFDEYLKCTYHGELDDSRPGNGKPVSGKSIREALNRLLNNETPLENQRPSIGCSIKWKQI
ncbi:MAG: thioredoxin family protein [Bacteroidetes bacterium]|nr:thioredoxin family protein [Bacteroidota bacterium]